MATYTYTPVPDQGAKAGVLAYLVISCVVLLLMMLFGLLMRMEQAQSDASLDHKCRSHGSRRRW